MRMKATKSTIKEKPEADDGRTWPPWIYFPVTDEIRQLASDLEKSFKRIYPEGKESERKAMMVCLILPDEFLKGARDGIIELGKGQNALFPSSFADYLSRHASTARTMGRMQESGCIIPPDSRTEWPSILPIPRDESGQNELRLKLGKDPLEGLIILRGSNDQSSVIVIFLDQYLPSKLAEMCSDLAHARREYCPLSRVCSRYI
jgi:hypothetical protein